MNAPVLSAPVLQVRGLSSGYGSAQVLFGVDLVVQAGEALALVGRNGMGKTTLVKTIMGLLPAMAGHVRVAGHDVAGLPPYRVAQAGLGLVPEGRQIFPSLSVEENLTATAASRFGQPRWSLGEVYAFLPRLKERRHNRGIQLSGGEQQMLALGRALMTNPKLLILDEATEGLAPLVRAEIWDALSQLKAEGMAILVIDKSLVELARLADAFVVLEKGHVVWQGSASDVKATPMMIERYLHV